MEFGSGSAVLGGTDPLQQAIARRATGQAGGTAQVTSAAPGFDPTTQVPQAPQGTPQAPQSPTAQGTAPQAPLMPFDSSEAKMIVSSLAKRLDSHSKFNLGS